MTTWNEDREYVKTALAEIKVNANALRTGQVVIGKEIAALKVKAGIWGLIGGMLPVAIALSIWALQSLT